MQAAQPSSLPVEREEGASAVTELRKLSETRGSDVQASVQTHGCVLRRHDADVVPRARGMNRHRTRCTRREN
eukprot:6186864-Pleurochrysis_carterae.AAC.1